MALIAILVALAAFPLLWVVHMSFKTDLEAFRMPPKLWIAPTLANYVELLEEKFFQSFWNSTVVSCLATVLSLVLGVPAAYALSRWGRRGQALSLWILFTRMAPPIAFGLPFFFIYRQLGMLDSLLGLAVIYLTFNLSLVIWMMSTYFDGLPRSLEEAAYIDGAGHVQVFFRISLPLSTPGLATTAILCFLWGWNDFFYALILTRSQAMTAPVAIVNFMNYEGWAWGKITAASVLVMLPVIFFSFLVRKYLVQGLTAGAVRG